MDFFEQELRKLAAACNGLSNPVFAGRACYSDLGGNILVKLQFVEEYRADYYSALKATIINRTEGEVDALLFRFVDIWGRKINPDSQDGITPHINVYGSRKSGFTMHWYVYYPNEADFRQLAALVDAYIDVFTGKM